MKVSLTFCAAIAAILLATPSWAQSLTPIQGWVPFDSPKAKLLMQGEPIKPPHVPVHEAGAH